MKHLVPILPIEAVRVDVVVIGRGFAYHFKSDYWFRFKVSSMPSWARQTIIREAESVYDLDPTSKFRIRARAFSGDMIDL